MPSMSGFWVRVFVEAPDPATAAQIIKQMLRESAGSHIEIVLDHVEDGGGRRWDAQGNEIEGSGQPKPPVLPPAD